MKAFVVGKLIDGTGAPPLENAVLLVEANRITELGIKGEIQIPHTAEIVEAPTSVLMPGMVDVHVHLAYSGIPHQRAFRAETVDMSYPKMALRAAAYAMDTLKAGFTSVRDLNAPGGVVIDLRDAINNGYLNGPRIKACGLGLSVTGGHMDQPGWGDHVHHENMTCVCDGSEGFRKGVRKQVKRGADLIKINVCVSSIKDLSRPYIQEMSDEEIAAACQEAHELGRHVAAHTSGGPAITKAVKAGLDSVEHGHWIDEETADLMAEYGTTYVPTLLVNERNFDFTKEDMGASADSWRWLELSREAKWESLERVHKAGVKIAVGTDSGFMLPHGEMNSRELELLVKGGLSPLEALCAATKTGAELLELHDLGTLEVGKIADMILVDGDPLQDIQVLRDQTKLTVFQAGKLISEKA